MIYDKRTGLYLPNRPRNQGYGYGGAGASHTKRGVKGFTALSGAPWLDIDDNNYTLRQRARMLYMASPIAASAARTLRTNVIGVGLKLKARIDRERLGLSEEQAAEWQKAAEAEFRLWASDRMACDATGVNDFYEMQQLALLSWVMSGDCLVLLQHKGAEPYHPHSLRLMLVESDRVATPYEGVTAGGMTKGRNPDNGNLIFDGVEVDASGAVVAYHVRSTHPNEPTLDKNSWSRVEAVQKRTGIPNALLVMDSERPGQYRGVSAFAQVIEPILQMRRYTESELMAALVESYYTAFIISDSPDPTTMLHSVAPQEEPNRDDEIGMGPGMTHRLMPGEDVKFGDPTRPAGGFPEFMSSLDKQVGAGMEIPEDLLMKKFDASYSASRAALLEAWKSFKMRREWFISDFCCPIYETWLAEEVAIGRLKAPGFFSDPAIRAAWLGSEWIGPSQGQIDPVKEITAEIMACQHGFSTHEESTIRLNGGDWNRNMERLKRETDALAEIMPQPQDTQTEREKQAE